MAKAKQANRAKIMMIFDILTEPSEIFLNLSNDVVLNPQFWSGNEHLGFSFHSFIRKTLTDQLSKLEPRRKQLKQLFPRSYLPSYAARSDFPFFLNDPLSLIICWLAVLFRMKFNSSRKSSWITRALWFSGSSHAIDACDLARWRSNENSIKPLHSKDEMNFQSRFVTEQVYSFLGRYIKNLDSTYMLVVETPSPRFRWFS